MRFNGIFYSVNISFEKTRWNNRYCSTMMKARSADHPIQAWRRCFSKNEKKKT